MNYKEAIEYAFKRNDEIPPVRFRHKETVVSHLDGSVFHVRHAVKETKDIFTFIFSEHHHPLVFFSEDLIGESTEVDDGK